MKKGFKSSAAENGDATDALDLGRLLVERGDLAAAAVAYRRADKRGDPAAATNLGVLLEQEGDLAGAAAAYRRASDRGHAAGAVSLGRLLARHHDVVGAEAAFRRASALGDERARDLLADLLGERRGRAVTEVGGSGADGDSGAGKPAASEAPLAADSGADEPATPEAPVAADSTTGDDAPAPESQQPDAPPESPQPDAPPEPQEPDARSESPQPDAPSDSQRRVERVKALQAVLSFLGFDPGPADGRYGPSTTEAVTRFQKAHDLPVDGVLGPRTAEALKAVLQPPTRERMERIKALQRQLSLLGLEPGPVDGRYGPLTTGAVTRFQREHGLKVDGLAGPLTAGALAASARGTRPATAPTASGDSRAGGREV